MDFIKDKTKCINSINELIDCHGTPKQLANELDELFFDWLVLFGDREECIGSWFSERVQTIKAIKNFFSEIETI
jgi:hypothetical protein